MKKQSIIMLCCVSFLLIVSVEYALLGNTIEINGTATAMGTFDVEFSDSAVVNQVGSIGASTIISQDKNTLEINVPNLQYPGAYVEITTKVSNKGSIPAMLTNVESEGLTTDPNVKISYEGLEELKNTSMSQDDTQTFKIIIMWDRSSKGSSKDVKFSIKLLYKQAV